MQPTVEKVQGQKWPRETVLEMHRLYMDEDKTLRDLGEMYGCSYEHVRNLFEDNGLPTERPKRQTINRYAKEFEAWERQDEIFALYEEHGIIDKVATILMIPKPYVAGVVATMPLRQIHRRKGNNRVYTKKTIKDCLRQAALICGEPLTIPHYRRYAPMDRGQLVVRLKEEGYSHKDAIRLSVGKVKWPADLTVIRAFSTEDREGTWEIACKAAGVKVNGSQGPRKGAITKDECLNALRLFKADCGEIPSYEKYSVWARQNRQPSGPTVRVKAGPWSKALRDAFE